GHPAGYRPQGYLFVATNEGHLAYLRENFCKQVDEGLKSVQLLDAGDVSKIAPEIRSDDIVGGTFCPTDGFVDPHSVMMGFMLKARERGVRLWLDTAVTGIETDRSSSGSAGGSPAAGGKEAPFADPDSRFKRSTGETPAVPVDRRITGVTTTRGHVSTPIVVNAAGPWAAEVARMAGTELPVQPLRRQLVPTEPFDGLPQR